MPSYPNETTPVIKTEKDSMEEMAGEGVFHRKSKRRRVARDIFLVFEEQPSSRRSRGRGSAIKKSKFGHLKVENPTKKCLLRDIKNEPKCYSNQTNSNKTSNNSSNCPNKTTKSNDINKQSPPVSNDITAVAETAEVPARSLCTKSKEPALPNEARVNPIFLWVKQDDTRIVEVRCEDYDKRNRIRITKTTNGWKSIPRTDPTSSRIVKFFQTPMLKVKRELYSNHTLKFDKKAAEASSYISQVNEDINETMQVDKEWDDVEPAHHKDGTTVTEQLKKDKSQQQQTQKQRVKNTLSRHKCSNKKRSKRGKNIKHKKEKCETESSLSNDIEKQFETLNNVVEESAIVSDSGLGSQEPIIQKDIFQKRSDTDATAAIFTTHATSDTYQLNNCTATKNQRDNKCNNDEDQTILQKDVDHNENLMTPMSELQLCPKTGLFLRNIIAKDKSGNSSAINVEHKEDGLLIDLEDSSVNLDAYGKILDGDNIDVETKNLKDLLDDADDLLQHCNDNANSDADLIDSLVKRSCENNLIQETNAKDEISNTANLQMLLNTGADVIETTTTNNDNPHIVETVSEPPNCLSFNEVGEIEGINGELFQSSSNLGDSFENDDGIIINNIPIHDGNDNEIEAMGPDITSFKSVTPVMEKESDGDKIVEIFDEVEAPRDLTYKKREEVCPPPESRSQCAVTSSSDVVKSPMRDDVPPVIDTSSDTIKNLIFEQFMKINSLNSNDSIASPMRQQTEPIDLGTHKQHTNVSNFMSNTNFIETVVIDDNSDEEPVKKRVRRHAVPHSNQHGMTTAVPASTIIDKDPDPLTQLQLLIKNTQWKVPDPILVPKDRLGAVLASPAREIPLLITTRPELRLPEAFAYPEIIQNPNILVISMAQLEAILKNEMESEKNKSELLNTSILSTNECDNSLSNQYHNALPLSLANDLKSTPQSVEIHPTTPMAQNLQQTQLPMETHQPPLQSKDTTTHCATGETNLTSINATTLAVLNQLLWLPYFGQLSHEFLKKIKEPINSMQKNVLPQYHLPSQFGLQNLDELFKCSNKHNATARTCNSTDSIEPPTPCYTPNSMTPLQNPLEIAIFQKLVEQQMHNLLRLSAYSASSDHDSKLLQSAIKKQSTSSKNCIGQPLHHAGIDTKRTNKPGMKTNECYERFLEVPQKTHHNSNGSKNVFLSNFLPTDNCFEKEVLERENKPRLTCKSLSNLLQPDVETAEVASNRSFNFNAQEKHEMDLKSMENKTTEAHCLTSSSSETNLRMVRNDRIKTNIENAGIVAGLAKQQQRKPRCLNFMEQTNAALSAADSMNGDANVLWHPLFGSNSKSGYSSPWQWTTVTATGE